MQEAPSAPAPSTPRSCGTLSLDHKRQVVYSSLLRFSAEAIPLREAALDHVVLGSLLGSTDAKPYKIGQLQSNLSFGATSPQIRDDAVRQALIRLIEQEKVKEHLGLAKKSFSLTPKGSEELDHMIGSSEAMFDAVLRNLLRDTEHLFAYDRGCVVCRKFIFECFGRFGRNIARTVTGNLDHEELIQAADVNGAFQAAIQGMALSPAAMDSLRTRCTSFLRSKAPEHVQLKYHLSQGYYFAQLLGFEDKGFNPLSKEAFANSTFYLDTNVLLAGVLAWQAPESLFDEVVTVARRLGITLKVTRATLNEARRVITDKEQDLTRIFSTLPAALIMNKSDDEFILAFILARERNSSLTVSQFFSPLHSLDQHLTAKWGIVLDERTESELMQSRTFDRARDLVGTMAEKYRAYKKSDTVIEHDVAHYALVQDERKTNPKTWFLTRDRTLMEAASQLAQKTQPFSFLLLGFLHSISPFLTAKQTSLPFVEVLSAFITQEILPTHALFSTAELAIMAEFHDEVMCTPSEQLELAFDYIKSKVLEGKQYKAADIPKVSLELRKFLTKPKEEQIRALEAERQRLEAARQAAEDKACALQAETDGHKITSEALRAELAALKTSHSRIEGTLGSLLANQEKRAHAWRFCLMVLGLAIGTAGFWFSSHLVNLVSQPLSLTTIGQGWADLSLRILSAIIFVAPAYSYLMKRRLSETLTTVLLCLVVATCLYASHIFSKEAVSEWADSIGFATPIVVALVTRSLCKQRASKTIDAP